MDVSFRCFILSFSFMYWADNYHRISAFMPMIMNQRLIPGNWVKLSPRGSDAPGCAEPLREVRRETG